MKTKAESKAATRHRLLQAATRVIRSKGYAATTVDDVAELAGVTKGGFFHHFKSKEDLAIAAAEFFSNSADEFFAAAPYQKSTDPLDKLLKYVDFRISIMQGETCEYTCLLGTLVQETYATNPSIREACNTHLQSHAAMLTEYVSAAKKRYAPRARWTSESVAQFIMAALQGAFILSKAQSSPNAPADCLKHLRKYLESLFRG